MLISPREMLELFHKHGVITQDVHARYSKHTHANIDFNFRHLFASPALMRKIAREIALIVSTLSIEVVVSCGQGSGKGMYALSHYVAGAISDESVVADIKPLFAEIDAHNEAFGYQKFVRDRRVLILLDLFDHEATLAGVVKGVNYVSGKIVGVVALCNTGKLRMADRLPAEVKTRALTNVDLRTWELSKCPHCQGGIDVGKRLVSSEV